MKDITNMIETLNYKYFGDGILYKKSGYKKKITKEDIIIRNNWVFVNMDNTDSPFNYTGIDIYSTNLEDCYLNVMNCFKRKSFKNFVETFDFNKLKVAQ
tara:strand:+ start:15882 stop:16178 length:297 start_codon:yes stop_codon:yes gene_type:complete